MSELNVVLSKVAESLKRNEKTLSKYDQGNLFNFVFDPKQKKKQISTFFYHKKKN